MFKSQRRLNRGPKNENIKKIHNALEVEEVYNAKARRLQPTHFGDKNKTNRCTIIKPSYKDFGQFTEILQSPNTYKNTIREKFGITPVIPETIKNLKELKKIICQSDYEIEKSSSYGTATGKSKVDLIENSSDEMQWQNVENTTDLYKFIPRRVLKTLPSRKGKIVSCREKKLVKSREEKKKPIEEKHVTCKEEKRILRDVKLVTNGEENIIPTREVKIVPSWDDIVPTREGKNAEEQNVKQAASEKTRPLPTHIRIAEVPRIKVMAEKFAMFKKNNIELRRLEEKVVCLEYGIYDGDAETGRPFQIMRAFFSIKPQKSEGGNDDIATLPSDVKRDFDIAEEDLTKLNKKEIEIIDEHLPENRSLLEDLKKVLRRNQVLSHKKEGSLDLMYLYEMAKRQNVPLDEDYLQNNVLTNEELTEIKEMILKKSVSSIHGVSRRKVKNRDTQGDGRNSGECEISNSLVMELLREVKIGTAKA